MYLVWSDLQICRTTGFAESTAQGAASVVLAHNANIAKTRLTLPLVALPFFCSDFALHLISVHFLSLLSAPCLPSCLICFCGRLHPAVYACSLGLQIVAFYILSLYVHERLWVLEQA